MGSLLARVKRLEEARRARQITTPDAVEAACFDWYGTPCSCEAQPCRVHPRARPSQHPPAGDWKTVLWMAGRGYGKTRTGAEWVRHNVQTGQARRIALVAPTEADARDVMIDGESGLMAVSPDWFRPIYEPSKRRLTWPNGAIATTYSAERPQRLRGPQHDLAWCDELGAWFYGEQTWDMLMFGLRLGRNPRVCVTTTPKPSKLVKSLLADATTAVIRGSTYENRDNLAPTFFDKVISKYEGTRLGQQEIYAEVLEVSEGAWFSRFDPAKHVTEKAEYHPRLPVYLGIDAGTSRTTGAVWFQVLQTGPHTHLVTVFGEYMHQDRFSEENAKAIRRHGESLPCQGRIDSAWIDPASDHRTSIGPNAYNEYERTFGNRILSRSPGRLIVDGLDQMELLLERGELLIHPRCVHLKAAFQNYRRMERQGEYLNKPAESQSPHEDMIDALRYGIRAKFPEGRQQPSNIRQTHASRL